MFQSNYQKNLEAVKIKPDELKNLQNKSDSKQVQYDPFVIEEDIAEQSNKVTDAWRQEQAKRQNLVATLLEVQEDEEDEEEAANFSESGQNRNIAVEPISEVRANPSLSSSSWKALQAQRQNQVATLLEVKEDEENTETSPTPKPTIHFSNPTIEYKLIGINQIQQLNYFKSLISSEFIQSLRHQNNSIILAGIIARVNKKNVGLILADISTRKGVAQIINLSVLPKYSQQKIKKKLILGIKKNLPKFKCDRLEYKI